MICETASYGCSNESNRYEISNYFSYIDRDHYSAGIHRDLMKSWNILTRQTFGR